MAEKPDICVGVSPRFQAVARELLSQLLQAFEQEMVDAHAESFRLRSEIKRLRAGSCTPSPPVLTTPPLEAALPPTWPEGLLDSLPSLCEQYIDLEGSELEDVSAEPAASFVDPKLAELTVFSPATSKPINSLALDLVPQPKNSGGVLIGDEATAGSGSSWSKSKVSNEIKFAEEVNFDVSRHVAQEVRSSGALISSANNALTPPETIQGSQEEVDNNEVRLKPHHRPQKKLISHALDQSLWTEAEEIIKDSRISTKKKKPSVILEADAREARVAAEIVAQKYQREAAVKRISRAQRNSILQLPQSPASSHSPSRTSVKSRQRSSMKSSRKGSNSEGEPMQATSRESSQVSDPLGGALDKFNIEVDIREEAMRLAQEELFQPPDLQEEEEDENPTFRRKMARIVKSIYFDITFAVVIIVNSIFMGIQIDHSVSHPDKETPAIFYIMGYMFTLVFLFELIIRMLSYPSFCRFICSYDQWHWNWLDMIIVTSSLVEVVFDMIYFTSSSRNDSIDMSSMRIVRIIRLTRLLRVLRIGRIVRFIRALRILVFSILNTLRTVFWALLLLVIIIYVFGMVFAQVVSDHISSAKTYKPDLWRYWGTLPRSIFTLFKAIASGVSWHEVVEPLAVLHPAWVAFFIVYISFTFFAVLNVITGIFCERAIESVRQDHELVVQQHLLNRALYINTVKRLFKAIDVDDSNFISYKEFEVHLRDEHAVAFFAALELETNDAWEVFRLIKRDEEDGIDVDDFVEGCLRLRGTAKAIDIAKMTFETRKFHEGILRMLKTLGLAVEKTHKAVRESHTMGHRNAMK